MRLDHQGTTARLIVPDTGCGIASDMLPYLFLEFWQGSKSGHRSSGLGLGLAIVRHLVELHGGTVGADSTGPGCGTTFVIELPLAERHAAWAVVIETVEETSRSPRELATRDGDHSVVEAP